MTQAPDRMDYTALSHRMSYLLGLRAAMASIVVAWTVMRPEVLGAPISTVAAISAGYLITAVAAELVRRRSDAFGYALLSSLLLLDGLYLAWAMYVTGGTQSPIRFLTYLHLVAVSLLAGRGERRWRIGPRQSGRCALRIDLQLRHKRRTRHTRVPRNAPRAEAGSARDQPITGASGVPPHGGPTPMPRRRPPALPRPATARGATRPGGSAGSSRSPSGARCGIVRDGRVLTAFQYKEP